MIEKIKTIVIFSICTLIFVSGEGGILGLSHALVPAQDSKRSLERLLLLPVIQKGLFLARKSRNLTSLGFRQVVQHVQLHVA